MKILRIVNLALRHWMSWPIITLLASIVVFISVFSNNGYLAYLNLQVEKNELELEVMKLSEQVESFKKKVGRLQDDEKAIKAFSDKFKVASNTMEILKFEFPEKNLVAPKEIQYNIRSAQKLFIIIATLFIFSVTFFSYKFTRHDEAFELD